ncbi:MAG: glycosyltransferase family 2 protein [Rudaea sp.]
MSDSRVDVVIPTYNRAYCLARTIDSVLEQTHPHCRALVIDDGSTDATRSLIGDRYGGNPSVVYVHRANGGVAAARNTGLAMVGGDYVALLDSDDLWQPWKIKLQLDCLRALPGVGMIWTDMSAVDSDGKLVEERYLRRMYGAYSGVPTEAIFAHSDSFDSLVGERIDIGTTMQPRVYWGDIFSRMVSGNLVHTSTVLMTRDRAARVGGFNESFKYSGEDFDFHLRTCREGPVAFVDVPSIYYRIGNEDQLTRPEYRIHMAMNFLATIEPVIRDDRSRITMSEAELNALQARAHAWISNVMFEDNDPRGALRHSRASLRYVPLQKRMWLIFMLSMLPEGTRARLLRAYRRSKKPSAAD